MYLNNNTAIHITEPSPDNICTMNILCCPLSAQTLPGGKPNQGETKQQEGKVGKQQKKKKGKFPAKVG